MVRPLAVLVPLTVGAAGLLFATSAATAQGTDLRADRRLQITELLARERVQVLQAEQRAQVLRAELDGISEREAAADVGVRRAGAPEPLLQEAGLLAQRGPGVRVTLDDAPRQPGRPALSPDPDDLVVHQQDLQSVVNALWAGGARAVSLMDQRLVSTSAVRCVGNTVILHGRVYSPPFVVAAVGEPDALRRSLDDDPGVAFFRTFVERYGVGYEVSDEDQLRLPGYDGPLELPHVVTVEGSSGGPSVPMSLGSGRGGGTGGTTMVRPAA